MIGLTPGVRNSSRYWWRRAWLGGLARQKLWRNAWAYFIISCILTSSFWNQQAASISLYQVWSSLHNKRVLAWINSHEILRKLNRIIAKRYSTSLLKFSLFLNIKCVKLMLKKIRFKCAFFFVEKYMNVKKKASCICISGRGKMSLQFHMRSGEAPALHWGRSCSVAGAVRVS